MKRIAILISGRGTNMVALAERVASGDLQAGIAFVGADRENASGLERARAKGLPVAVFPYGELGRSAAEEDLAERLEREGVEWIVLAGFMRILSPRFVERFQGRIVNIHPSLLPSFPGTDSIRQAWEYGVRVTGVTVHIVDGKVDHGPILAQVPVPVGPEDSFENLETAIHRAEHGLYWKALKDLFASKQVNIEGRRLYLGNQ